MSGPVDINQEETYIARWHLGNHCAGGKEIEKSMSKSMTQFSLPAAGGGVTAAQYLQTLMTNLKTFLDQVAQNASDADHGKPLSFPDVESKTMATLNACVASAPSVAKGTAPVSVKYDELVTDLHAGDYYKDSESDQLWGADGIPTIGDVNQSNLGDCWLLAAVGSMVEVDPQRVKDLIHDNGDGTYTVHMAKGDVVVDGTMLPNTNDGNAKWVKIIENAYAQTAGDSYDDLDGGYGSNAMKDIFGLESDSYDPESGFTIFPHKDPEKAFDDIQQAFKDGKPVTVSVGDHGFGGNHELAVTALATKNNERCIGVRNPWGVNGDKSKWNAEVIAHGGTIDPNDPALVWLPADAAGDLLKGVSVGK